MNYCRVAAGLWGVICLTAVSAAAPDEPGPIQESPGVVHPSVYARFDGDDPAERTKVWVLMRSDDRGFAGEAGLRAAVARLADTYNPKAVQRRRARRTRPGLFDVRDLPVGRGYLRQISETGAEVKVVSRWLNGVSVRATRDQIAALSRLSFVRKIQPVRRGRKILPSGFNPQGEARETTGGSVAAGMGFYGEAEEQLAQIGLTTVHAMGYTGDGVVVGILDTGFNRTHDAFNDPGHEVSIVAEYDFINDDSDTAFELGDPETQHSHGTYILGVLGAYLPNTLVGGAYDASFILCKTEDTADEYIGEEDNYVAGLEFIEANGGDMATSSLGYIDWYTQEDLDGMTAITTVAVNIATGNGLHCCTAAGNAGHDADPTTSSLIAPSDAHHVLTCGAVESTGEIAGFSSDGPTADGRVKPELLARGVDTRTVASLDDQLITGVNGTSLSTPLVACALACLIEAHPEWTVEQMRTYLMATSSEWAMTGTYDSLYVHGYGVVDAAAALDSDCDGNGVSDVTDIAMGTHLDCNENDLPDACDVTFEHAADVNGNQVPDVCEGFVPAVSSWGVAVMALLALTAGTLVFAREHNGPCSHRAGMRHLTLR